jgi:carboxyl-terminal processing protease
MQRCLVLFLALFFFVSPLSAADHAKLFDQVWTLINEKYYDPAFNGVDWNAVRERYRPRVDAAKTDAEFYIVLKEMAGELHDAHTRFRSPLERDLSKHKQTTTVGLTLSEIEGQPAVFSVTPDSEASRAGIEPGMIVTSIDGMPFEKKLSEAREEVGPSSSERASQFLAYRSIVRGEPGSILKIGLNRANGEAFEASLTRQVISAAPAVEARVLPSGLGYIKFPLFDKAVAKDFKQKLETIRSAPGIIIDVRGNPGGEVSAVQNIMDNFLAEKTLVSRITVRGGKNPSLLLRMEGLEPEVYAGHAGGQLYAGPVVILINQASGSGAELFSGAMQEIARATILGLPSCGCVLGTEGHKVADGAEVDVSEFMLVTGKGRKLENTGVIPDKTVPLTLADLRNHRDAALEEATRSLTGQQKQSKK